MHARLPRRLKHHVCPIPYAGDRVPPAGTAQGHATLRQAIGDNDKGDTPTRLASALSGRRSERGGIRPSGRSGTALGRSQRRRGACQPGGQELLSLRSQGDIGAELAQRSLHLLVAGRGDAGGAQAGALDLAVARFTLACVRSPAMGVIAPCQRRRPARAGRQRSPEVASSRRESGRRCAAGRWQGTPRTCRLARRTRTGRYGSGRRTRP